MYNKLTTKYYLHTTTDCVVYRNTVICRSLHHS